MSDLRFLRDNSRWIGAGALMTGMSLFGQTSFISLFAGVWQEEFGLSHGEWGGIYTIGTLVSALLMMWAGAQTDRYRARYLGTIVLVIMALVCVIAAVNVSVYLLPVIIFGLRFSGQGMMFHIALVAMGKWFARRRGRAISLATLGFSFTEAVFPITFVALTSAAGWRTSWIVAGALALLAIIPLRRLLREERHPQNADPAQETAGMNARHWTRGEATRHPLFWLIIPCILSMPIFGTALLFQQVHLTELKGWTLEVFVGFYPLYSAASLVAILFSGWAVDRWGSGIVAPLGALAMAICFMVMALGAGLPYAALGLALLGMQQGISAAAIGAFWAEYYGTRNLGQIKALASSLMVFGTAIGPGVTGWLIDLGYDFRHQLQGMAAISAVSAVIFLVGALHYRAQLTERRDA